MPGSAISQAQGRFDGRMAAIDRCRRHCLLSANASVDLFGVELVVGQRGSDLRLREPGVVTLELPDVPAPRPRLGDDLPDVDARPGDGRTSPRWTGGEDNSRAPSHADRLLEELVGRAGEIPIGRVRELLDGSDGLKGDPEALLYGPHDVTQCITAGFNRPAKQMR